MLSWCATLLWRCWWFKLRGLPAKNGGSRTDHRSSWFWSRTIRSKLTRIYTKICLFAGYVEVLEFFDWVFWARSIGRIGLSMCDMMWHVLFVLPHWFSLYIPVVLNEENSFRDILMYVLLMLLMFEDPLGMNVSSFWKWVQQLRTDRPLAPFWAPVVGGQGVSGNGRGTPEKHSGGQLNCQHHRVEQLILGCHISQWGLIVINRG